MTRMKREGERQNEWDTHKKTKSNRSAAEIFSFFTPIPNPFQPFLLYPKLAPGVSLETVTPSLPRHLSPFLYPPQPQPTPTHLTWSGGIK